jgi:hypothetical protein
MNRDKTDEREDRRWNRVYLAIVVYTVLLIAGLWWFSQIFQ